MARCIYCFSLESSFLYSTLDIRNEEYRFHRCENCKVCFLYPLPSEDQLKRAYDEDYYGLNDKKFSELVENVVEWFRIRNAKQFAKYIKNGGRVLDVGCGNGSFLSHVGRQGNFELFGIEPEGKSADRASLYKKINLNRGYLEEKSYPEEYFDAIIFTHVFEHLPNPSEILTIIQKITKPGAILQIEIPNIDSWQASIFRKHWFHLDPPRHLNLFPPNRLKLALKDKGWEMVSEKYFSPQFSVFGVQQSILNMISVKRDALYEYLKGNNTYIEGVGKLVIRFHQWFHWISFPVFMLSDFIASCFRKGGTVKFVFKKQ